MISLPTRMTSSSLSLSSPGSGVALRLSGFLPFVLLLRLPEEGWEEGMAPSFGSLAAFDAPARDSLSVNIHATVSKWRATRSCWPSSAESGLRWERSMKARILVKLRDVWNVITPFTMSSIDAEDSPANSSRMRSMVDDDTVEDEAGGGGTAGSPEGSPEGRGEVAKTGAGAVVSALAAAWILAMSMGSLDISSVSSEILWCSSWCTANRHSSLEPAWE